MRLAQIMNGVRLVFAMDPAVTSAAAEVMKARLVAGGVEHLITVASDMVVVDLGTPDLASQGRAMELVKRRGRLGLRLVDDAGPPLAPPDRDRKQLLRALADVNVPADREVFLEHVKDEWKVRDDDYRDKIPHYWRAHLVHRDEAIDLGGEVASARGMPPTDPWMPLRPRDVVRRRRYVEVTLRARAAEQVAELARTHRGREVAMLLDDRLAGVSVLDGMGPIHVPLPDILDEEDLAIILGAAGPLPPGIELKQDLDLRDGLVVSSPP